MALDYKAIVLGRTTPEQMAARLYPDDTDRPRFDVSRKLWVGDDRPRRGYTLYIVRRKDGYVDASEGHDGPWIEKELPAHLQVEFVLDKERPGSIVNPAVLEKLARLLETGDEDVMVIQNGDILLLRRSDGELKRYRAGFWETMPPEAIPPVFRIPAAAPSE